jgi:DMSO/TMAO reductase YedYZ molybdopterin-dependent catalytic subunit
MEGIEAMSVSNSTPKGHPIFDPAARELTEGAFSREEVRLANRNSGTLLEMLRHDLTPAGLHYLLIHFDVPHVPSADGWILDIGGLVERPMRLTLGELQRCPEQTIRVTLECAGNGRATLTPRSPSQPWHHEAVGTAEWTGTPLKALLERAGLAAGARDVVFYGRDRGFDCGVEHNYGRSLAPEAALGGGGLLAWAMNGAPLLPQHGFPLRLIVPGWYGMASVKWLDRIQVIDRPFDGFQQVDTYTYRKSADDPGDPVTTMRVRSLMVPPGIPDWYSRRRVVERGKVALFGRAWSGRGVPITGVEVAVAGRWREASLDPATGRYAWRGWRFEWHATPGEHELMCRATDADGETQPIEPRFDRGGFGNNAVQRVHVTVR